MLRFINNMQYPECPVMNASNIDRMFDYFTVPRNNRLCMPTHGQSRTKIIVSCSGPSWYRKRVSLCKVMLVF